MAAATPASRMEACMHDADWWNSLLATIDGKRARDFAHFLTDDGEFRFGNQPAVHGREGIEAYVAAFFGMIGRSRHEIERTWNDGDTRVCQGHVTYTRLDGSTLTVPFANVFYMRGDRIARYLIFIDNGALFAPG
jgi:ketosteroid isomerase-like protein